MTTDLIYLHGTYYLRDEKHGPPAKYAAPPFPDSMGLAKKQQP